MAPKVAMASMPMPMMAMMKSKKKKAAGGVENEKTEPAKADLGMSESAEPASMHAGNSKAKNKGKSAKAAAFIARMHKGG